MEIPDTSNFFSALHTRQTREQIADLFRSAGWTIVAPDDAEHLRLECRWAELILESESPILLHGPVADVLNHAETIVAPLSAAKISFNAECYGPEPERLLLRELR
jgi:hypothetical protein